jgi:UTP--glucose-1-phosphate uridylyltransferase
MNNPQRVKKAVFPVAGLGTRFLPATKSIPKEMLPIVDKPLIQYAVEEALEAGIDTLIFVTSRKKHAISDHFDTSFELESRLAQEGKTELLNRITGIVPDGVSRVHVTQTEALGLGHAVLCAQSVVGDEPFAILLADDMVRTDGPGALAQMVQAYRQSGSGVIGVEEIPLEWTSSYGIVGVEENSDGHKAIQTIVEKPAPEDAPSRLGVVGRYILDPAVFRYLREMPAGAGGEIQLTDGIAAMLKTLRVLALPFEVIKATIDYALEHEDLREEMLEHMLALLMDSGKV